MIIGITGKIGSGKSTVSNYIVNKYNYTEYSMASPLKEIASIFGFSHEQLHGTQEQKLQKHSVWDISARTFLQKVGTEMFRDIHTIIPDMKIEKTIWVDLFKQKYKKDPKMYVISDVRFLDEANMIKELGGVIIKTVRINNISSESKIEHSHISETEMEQIQPDFVIDNDIFDKEKAQNIVDNIILLLSSDI